MKKYPCKICGDEARHPFHNDLYHQAIMYTLKRAVAGIHNSGSAFEAEFHKGQVDGVRTLLVMFGMTSEEVDLLQAEAGITEEDLRP